MAAILTYLSDLGESLKDKSMGVIDSVFPPEKRAEVIGKLQAFAVANPKLSGFLLTNIALTGLPLATFAVFTLTVFVFALIAALLIGLLVALLFTVFMVGVALIFVLPTVFITTGAASFLFLWALGGYYIIKWFNEGQGTPPEGSAIGDKLNDLTGGRLNFIMDGARKKEDGKLPTGGADGVQGVAGQATKPADQVTKAADVDGVKKKTGGATSTATSTVGGAKGAVGGATGLA